MEGGFGYPPPQAQYHSHDGHLDVDVLAQSARSTAAGRQALQELAAQYGNALAGQLYGLGTEAYPSLMGLQRLPDAPVLPTQALHPAAFGPGLGYDRRQAKMAHPKSKKQLLVEANPLWVSPQFQAYRTKQKDKEDKQEQVWPDVLEAAFLDALLLIPQMQRRKYEIDKGQRGRNELIGEYLWLAYVDSLPPVERPVKKTELHPMYRKRKQVSSHIQVLKNLFYVHRCFHFFFPPKEQRKDDRRASGPAAGGESLKNNPVLGALKAGKMPKERPNYSYFKSILAMHDLVVVKPKRNWIFVTHRDLTVHADGSGTVHAAGHTGQAVSPDEWPRLLENLGRDKWPREEQRMVEGALVHEFAKDLKQVESTSVNEVALDWADDFPDLHARLQSVMQVERDETCDFLHMDVKLEMNGQNRFPAASSLNSCMEVNVDNKFVLANRWRVRTTLAIPEQLSETGQAVVREEVKNMHTEYHAGDCARRHVQVQVQDDFGWAACACAHKFRGDSMAVPFPADAWAGALQSCTDYPVHPPITQQEFEVKKESKNKPAEIKTVTKWVRAASADPPGDTQMDLVSRIAMMQELEWAPAVTVTDANAGPPAWTRRAVVLWSFATVHSFVTKSTPSPTHEEFVTSPAGTAWRFLTLLDPTSPEHLEKALISSPAAVAGHQKVTRDAVMSPAPGYRQALSASMSETLGSACYDPSSTSAYPYLSAPAASSHAVQASYLDDSAYCSSASSFHAFGDQVSADLAAGAYHGHGHHTQLVPAASSTAADLDSLAAVTDPFLAGGGGVVALDGLPVGASGWGDVAGGWPPTTAGDEHGHGTGAGTTAGNSADDVLDWASPAHAVKPDLDCEHGHELGHEHNHDDEDDDEDEDEHEHADHPLWAAPGGRAQAQVQAQVQVQAQAQPEEDWVHVAAQEPDEWEVVEPDTNHDDAPADGDGDDADGDDAEADAEAEADVEADADADATVHSQHVLDGPDGHGRGHGHGLQLLTAIAAAKPASSASTVGTESAPSSASASLVELHAPAASGGGAQGDDGAAAAAGGGGGGLKRARADSLEDRESYPFNAVPKLARLEGPEAAEDW